MLLQKKENGTLVELMEVQEIIDPNQAEVTVRVQDGQEEQDPEPVHKQDLIFPSGEALPRCWTDPNYREN